MLNAQDTIPFVNKEIADILIWKPQSTGILQELLQPIEEDTVVLKSFVEISDRSGYLLGKAFGENLLGNYHRSKSNYSKAIDYYRSSIATASQIDHVEMKISALNMLGIVYKRIGAVRSALDQHDLALDLAHNSKNVNAEILTETGIALNSIGNIYLLLGNYDLAETYFKQAITYAKEMGNDLGLAINYANLGVCFDKREQYKEAIDNYEISLLYNEKINNEMGIILCHNRIGQVFLKQGKPEQALRLIAPTLPKFNDLEDPYFVAMANINMGWALKDLKRYEEADGYLSRGAEIAKKKNIKEILSNAYKHLSELKAETESYKDAFLYQKLSQEVKETYLNEANQKYISDLNMKYSTERTKSMIDLLEKENEIVSMKLQRSQKDTFFISALFLLALLILYILYRQYNLKNEKRILKAEQKLMRSQMNPHFLFNALLSIKIYMQQNNVTDAIDYLNQFTRLIRSILSSSLQKEITLAEELETMELYVNIENIRFFNEIEYTVKVADEIKPDEIKIPSLILQPFIENAIWHGLQPKQGPKVLLLEIKKKEDQFIEITITDNGIGRKRTMEISRERQNTQKKSVGINLTVQRLYNFSKKFKNDHSITITDLYDKEDEAAGTQVLIALPVK